jgi:hypothetical protein
MNLYFVVIAARRFPTLGTLCIKAEMHPRQQIDLKR